VRDLCGIRDVNPELTFVTPANASGPGNVYASPVFPYCHTSTGYTTRVTGLAAYTVPKIDVLVSGTFRSEQGAPLAANFTVTNAMVAGQLGRNLSAPGGSVVVNLIEPGTLYGDRGGFPDRQDRPAGAHADQRRRGPLQPVQRQPGPDLQRRVQRGAAVPAAHRRAHAAVCEGVSADRLLNLNLGQVGQVTRPT
jgi:hypothetical protein